MNLQQALDRLPQRNLSTSAVAVLSGGLDSTIMTMLLMKKYGRPNVTALSYDYGQKQRVELERAAKFCDTVGIRHKILDLSILGEIAKPMSANIGGSDIDMPTIQDVLGDPQPKTYVPFRNMILLSLSLSFAESVGAEIVSTGLQVHDEYGYWDTSKRFVGSMNDVAKQNRTHKVEIIAPFSHLSKQSELELCKELDMMHLLEHTLTCYNPDVYGRSCARCPSCSERINAFMKAKVADPIEYQIDIPWQVEANVN